MFGGPLVVAQQVSGLDGPNVPLLLTVLCVLWSGHLVPSSPARPTVTARLSALGGHWFCALETLEYVPCTIS